jgi:hypothetical protein
MPRTSKNQFLGRWKLESCIGKSGNKTSFPIGEYPFGMLTYTEQYMMVFIASAERTEFSTIDIRTIPLEQIATDFPRFETYCGRYAIDDNEKIITHFIENSKIPNHIGTEFRRRFSFSDKKLLLESTASLLLNGEPWLFEIAWNREEGL